MAERTKYRTLGRVIAVVDDLAYCVFPGLLRNRIALAIPKELLGPHAGEPDFRFHVHMAVPEEFDRVWTHDDFDLSDFDLPKSPKREPFSLAPKGDTWP